MCVTTGKSEQSDSTIAFHANFRSRRHSLLYENTFENQDPGPNAMILPILGKKPVFHDTRPYKDVLQQVVKVLKPPVKSLEPPLRNMSMSVTTEIIKVGSYHVVIAHKADIEAIQYALKTLPVEKRPFLNRNLIAWYLECYGPDATLAICCFDGKAKAEPLYCEYEPINFGLGFWPGADSHDGDIPTLGEWVSRDHTLLFGALLPEGETRQSGKVDFRGPVPQVLRDSYWQYCSESQGVERNCDWIAKLLDAKNNSWTRVLQEDNGLLQHLR